MRDFFMVAKSVAFLILVILVAGFTIGVVWGLFVRVFQFGIGVMS